jgi:hypothetical protein
MPVPGLNASPLPPHRTDFHLLPPCVCVGLAHQYLGNMYHATEELFSLYETAHVVRPAKPLSEMRLVFAASASGQLIQMPSQVNNSDDMKMTAPGIVARKQILEMWSGVVHRPREQRLTPLADPNTKPTCFRKLLLPMRACHGSIGTASWERVVSCPNGNPIAEAVSHGVRRAFLVEKLYDLADMQITILTRATATKRVLRNSIQVKSAIEGLVPGVKVVLVSLNGLTFTDQIHLMWRTAVLMSPHGAGMSLLLFLPKGAGVLESTSHPPPFGASRSVAHIFWQYSKWTNHPYRHVANAENPNPASVASATKELYEGFRAARSTTP